MVGRCVLAIFISLSSLVYVAPAHGQVVAEFFRSVARDFRRNNCWPQPFVAPDRYATRTPFALMVQNGWRRQNMLAEHHFEEDGATLNESGRIKVQWIVTEAPAHHRIIYVHRADTVEETAARIAAVQELAARFVQPEGQLPEVRETSISFVGWPAAQVDAIERAWAASAPEPRLPASEGEAEAD